VVVGFVSLTGFFVAAEFALVAADRSRMERDSAARRRGARAALSIVRRLTFHLSATQLGITTLSLVLGFVGEPAVARVLEGPAADVVGNGSARGVATVVGFTLVTFSTMVFGELVPKNLAIARPVPVAYAVAAPLRVYALVFRPLVRLLTRAANGTVRRFGIEPQEELGSVRSLDELELLIRASGEEGAIDPQALTLLTRTIRFGNKTAADALVPRLAVRSVDRDATVADLLRTAVETGYSRFPVVGADLDDLAGVVHVKDVYRLPVEERATAPVTAIMREVLVVPESKELQALLVELRETGGHLAVVVDEFGGVAGIITLEDVLEEIVGDISDEYDPAAPSEGARGRSGSWVLSGALHADEVRDATGFEMPEGEFETLAGFVLHHLDRIPAPGDAFEHEGWTVEVVALDRRRVANVRLTAPTRPEKP